MMEAKTSAEDYQRRGSEYAHAWEMLARRCEYPPSLEQFEFELHRARRSNPGMTVNGLARRLSESYHRVQGFFEGDG